MSLFADFAAIQVGDTRTVTRSIAEADVRRFVEMTGDDNPLHVDRAYAEATSFRDIVVHGMLGASFISTVIGTQLPGPGALWVSQNLEFLLPVRLGDTLEVRCRVTAKHERDRLLELETTIVNQAGQTVLSGSGKVKVLEIRAASPATPDAERRRVALVTGGSGGIGRATALGLAAMGADLAITGRDRGRTEDAAREIRAAGRGQVDVFVADLSSQPQVRRLAGEVLQSLSRIDVLVNNAGG